MKKYISRLMLCAFCLPILFVGCSKDDDDETSPSSNNNLNNQNQADQMIFSVDGVERDFSDILFFGLLGSEVSIEGLEETDYPREELEVLFPDTTSTGVYSINGNSEVSVSFRRVDSSVLGTVYGDVYLTIDGSLNLTQIDTANLEGTGTFSFTAVNKDDNQDTVVVSGGKFNAVDN